MAKNGQKLENGVNVLIKGLIFEISMCFATPATVPAYSDCFDYVVDGSNHCFDSVVDGVRHCFL